MEEQVSKEKKDALFRKASNLEKVDLYEGPGSRCSAMTIFKGKKGGNDLS